MEYKGSLEKVGVKTINSPGLGEKLSDLLHISSAVVVPASSKIVITSGTTGYNANMEYPTDLNEQVLLAFENTEQALVAAGVKDGFRSVHQLTTYHAGGLGDDAMAAVDAAVHKYFGTNRPAWAGIGIEALFGGARIEIVATASIP